MSNQPSQEAGSIFRGRPSWDLGGCGPGAVSRVSRTAGRPLCRASPLPPSSPTFQSSGDPFPSQSAAGFAPHNGPCALAPLDNGPRFGDGASALPLPSCPWKGKLERPGGLGTWSLQATSSLSAERPRACTPLARREPPGMGCGQTECTAQRSSPPPQLPAGRPLGLICTGDAQMRS